MKTIKMVADELNVTKQTIVNNAKNLNISFKKENVINYINDNDCLKIIEKITKKERTMQNKESIKKERFNENTAEFEKHIYNNSNSFESLKTKVNELEKQIEIFETRAKNDEKYVNTLNKLLENQQILALESNKKIQKLENQLEEERQLNYSFDTATNDRQSINPQEATFTEEYQNSNQQQKKIQPIEAELNHKGITKAKKDDSANEDVLKRDDKLSEEIESGPEDREVETPKKGFWSRLFGS